MRYVIIVELSERKAVRTASMTGIRVAASCSLHSSIRKRSCRMDGLSRCISGLKISLSPIRRAGTRGYSFSSFGFPRYCSILITVRTSTPLLSATALMWGSVQSGLFLRHLPLPAHNYSFRFTLNIFYNTLSWIFIHWDTENVCIAIQYSKEWKWNLGTILKAETDVSNMNFNVW